MPDAFGRPTEEEKYAAAIRGGTMSPMTSGSSAGTMTPEQMAIAAKQSSGKRSKLKNQMAMANAMRGKEAAKGRTVGQGRFQTYMGPNAGDIANSFGQNLLGGYMAGKTNEGLEELDVAESETALAQAMAQRAEKDAALQVDADNEAYSRERDLIRDEVAAGKDEYGRERDSARDAERAAALVTDEERYAAEQIAEAEERALSTAREQARIAQADADREESRQRWEETNARLKASAELTEKRYGKGVADTQRREDRAYQTDRGKTGLPQAEAQFGELESMLTSYAERDPDTGEFRLKKGVTSIPGIGGVSNAPLGIGEVATYGADAVRGDDIGKDIKQLSQKIYNTEIKDLSGSAVSFHEMQRNLKAQGVDIFSGPEQFIQGMNAIERQYKAQNEELNMAHEDAYGRRQDAEAALEAENNPPETALTPEEEAEGWKVMNGVKVRVKG